MRLADRKPADRVAVKADPDQALRACTAQFRHIAALRDAEQHVAGGRGLKRALAALRPAQRELHRTLNIAALGRQPHAFIELHGDVGTEQPLQLDRALGRQLEAQAVDVRAEGHRAFADLAQLRQRHHLEAAGVGQDRTVPAGEGLQAAQGGNAFGTRSQHQMIGIAEHDVGAGIAHLAPVQALHGASGADRHEGRRPHHAMRRGQLARARRAVGRDEIEVIGKAHASAYRVTGMPNSTALMPIFGPKGVDAKRNLPHKPAP